MTGVPGQFDTLASAMRYAEVEHRVISQNIANANTPGYKSVEVSFDQLAQRIEAETPPENDSWQIEQIAGLDERADGNNVDLDQQVGKLKKNAMLFQTFSQLLASKIDTMKRAMSR